MAVAPQPQRELWSMDPTPVLQPGAVRADQASASRYPTAAWPSVPTSEPAPPAYKMPSPLIPSSPAPDARPAPRSVDEDLKDLLSGFNTPAPPTQMVAPSFPTQSPAPAPQVSAPMNNIMQASPQVPPASPQRPQMQQSAPASQGASMADVTNQLANFMRRVEENFGTVTRQLSEVERRLVAVEQASKEASEMNRMNAMEKKRMLETIQQQLTELRRQTAMATVAAAPPTPAYAPQPTPVPQAPAPVYTQPAPVVAPSPLPSYTSQRLPPLQPANSLYMPPPSVAPRVNKNDQEEADRLLALRLQEELNRDSGPSDLLPGVDTARANSAAKPTPGGPSHSEGHSECPICGMDLPLSQIEGHVNKHLEDNPNVATAEQKEGFLSWLFSGKKGQQPQAASRPEPPKLTPPKPSAPVAKAQPQPQVLNLGQPGLYPSQYRYGTAAPPPGMQIPPGMQLATIPPGAPIPPGAVPLGNYPSMYPPTQMYYSQVGQAP